MSKTVLIPWSGGLDSTFLVWKNLNEGNKVQTLYIRLQNNKAKIEHELAAREKLDREIAALKPYCQIEHLAMPTIDVRGSELFQMKQNCIWLLLTAYAVTKQVDEVQISYVLNDCSISYLEDMQRVWKAMSGFTSPALPPLTFPLMKWPKEEIYHSLPEPLRKHIWYCERVDVTHKPCKECVPCRRFAEILPIECLKEESQEDYAI